MTWSNLPLDLTLEADAYYSFDADGYFTEITCGHEFPISDKLSLIVSGHFGMNQGYVSDDHDGANSVGIRLGAENALTDSMSVVAQGTHNWGLDSEPAFSGDEQLNDFFLGGIGLEWSF